MKKKLAGLLLGIAMSSICLSVNVKAVDLQTALALQAAASEAYNQAIAQQASAQAAQQQTVADMIAAQQAAVLAQQQAAANAAAAQQQAVADMIAAQQAAVLAQQQAAADAAAAQQQAILNAQKSAMEVTTAIQSASIVTPQVDVICDTNCAEQNAILYSKTIPDFVLVDISEQKVVFYKNNTRILADNCVTGNASKGLNTTVGIHKILFKDLNRTLHGSYGEAFVRYWMRFTASGQGLHDAGWRNNFSPSVYVSNGSHGCVNLKRPTAQTIYENSYVGMFVIVEN